jgi:MarR family transcriptional regulator, organic hydroperoxide resistance regulator
VNEFLSLFTRASKVMRIAADEAMSRHGVRVGQNLVLEILWQQDGLTPGELATRLHVATPTVVKSANRMAAAGLITRRRDQADARLVRLYLTDRARSVQSEIERERDELARRATATLTSEEVTILMSALRKMIAQFAVEKPSDEAADAPGEQALD